MRRELGIPANHRSFSFSEPGFGVKDWGACFVYGPRRMAGIYLVVVGNDASSCTIETMSNKQDVIFVGPQTNVEDYYAAADLLFSRQFKRRSATSF